MENFVFYTPTKMIFGKDTHRQVGDIIKGYGYHKILLHYGGGSIKRTGLYNEVTDSLQKADISFVELGGVQPNPKLSLVKEGIELCRSEQVELILAVGGGSVMDSAKLMASGALYEGDPWDFSSKKESPKAALPVGTIVTLSASGSEMSSSAVITNEEGWLKRGFNSDWNRPLFSICNPELTYTLPPYQTACGIVDIMMHTLERYFSNSPDTGLTDRIAEGLLKSVIQAGKKAMEDSQDYEARETLMWAGSLSHNDLTGVGRKVFMVCHQIEHEISGLFDSVAHGAGLAVIFPAWAKYVYKSNPQRFAQFAARVWNVEFADLEAMALDGILETEQFFRSIGMPVRLSELGIGSDSFDELSEKCTYWGERTLPGFVELGKEEIIEVLELAK